MKLFIVIPAYNEEKRIGKTLEEYLVFFENLRKKKILEYEIFVVINNTKDKTEEVVRKFCKTNKNINYVNFKPGGKGFAVISGFKEGLKTDSDLIGFVDADMATSPEEYYKLAREIKDFDGAIADRYMKGAKIFPAFSFRRIVVSRVFNFLVRTMFLLPYRDTQTGAKIFKKEAINKVLPELGMTQWAFDIDLLYALKKNKFKIRSIPTVWYEREGSTLNIKKASLEMFFAIFQLRVLRSRFSSFIRLFKPAITKLHNALK